MVNVNVQKRKRKLCSIWPLKKCIKPHKDGKTNAIYLNLSLLYPINLLFYISNHTLIVLTSNPRVRSNSPTAHPVSKSMPLILKDPNFNVGTASCGFGTGSCFFPCRAANLFLVSFCLCLTGEYVILSRSLAVLALALTF